MTIFELSKGIEFTQYQSVKGEVNIVPADENLLFEINTQEELSAIFELFDNKTFRKSFKNLTPQGTKTYTPSDGDFSWRIVFQSSEEIVMGDGNSITGDILTVSNFYGELEIHFDGELYICATGNQEEWLKSVVDLLSDFK